MQQDLFDEGKSELEYELDYLKKELNCLDDENMEMREFFDKLAKPIIKRAVRKVEKQLRRFPAEARQFGDDSKLNSFEEICVMLQEGSMNDYMFVEDTVDECSENAYDDLLQDEKFILNHQTISPEEDGPQIIRNAFIHYASGYETKKINDAFYKRN
jgi:hypothetical protein